MTAGSDGRAHAVELRPEDGSQPAGRVFALVLEDLLEDLRSNEPAVLTGDDPEALHDYRVALRKARSILRAGERVYPAEELGLLQALTAELAAATSPVRDLDVLCDALDGYAAGVSEELADGVELLRGDLATQRERARSQMHAVMRGEQYPVLLRRWQVMASVHRLGGSEPGPDALRPARDVSGELIDQAYRRLVKGGRKRLRSSDPQRWHQVRKRAKRLRYLLGAFAPIHPDGSYEHLQGELPRLQDRLGELQDHVQHARILEETGLRLGGRAALAAGAIADELHHAAHRDLRRAAKRFEPVRAERIRREVRRARGG